MTSEFSGVAAGPETTIFVNALIGNKTLSVYTPSYHEERSLSLSPNGKAWTCFSFPPFRQVRASGKASCERVHSSLNLEMETHNAGVG